MEEQIDGTIELGKIIKGGIFAYIGVLVSNLLGLAFWVLAARFVDPSDVGAASAVLAFQGLAIALTSLGLPTGVKRFIGRGLGESDYDYVSSAFLTNLALMSAFAIPAAGLLLLVAFQGIPIGGLNSFEILWATTLILSSYWTTSFFSLFDSALRTQATASALILSALTRLGSAALFFVFMQGSGFLSIMLAFAISAVATDALVLLLCVGMFRQWACTPRVRRSLVLELQKSGFPAWLPNILNMAGTSLAVLYVFNLIGSVETGFYYMALVIAGVVYALPTSVQKLMYPVLSGMQTGHEEAIAETTRISLVFTAPLAIVLALYSHVPFLIVGRDFAPAAPLLSILVLGSIAQAVYAGYYGFFYAARRFLYVTILGLVLNMTRILGYFVLGSTLGMVGVALSYSTGILVALIPLAILSSRIGIRIRWALCARTVAVPAILAALAFLFSLSWFLGAPLVFFLSWVAYMRLRIVNKKDILDISCAFLSRERVMKVEPYLRPLVSLLFSD